MFYIFKVERENQVFIRNGENKNLIVRSADVAVSSIFQIERLQAANGAYRADNPREYRSTAIRINQYTSRLGFDNSVSISERTDFLH